MMQKFVLGLVVVAMTALGLVGMSTTSAQAVECPYTGCVETSTSLKGPNVVRKGQAVRLTVAVRARSGNARPTGSVVVKCTRPGAVKVKRTAYRGTPKTVKFVLNKAGKWTCTARFSSAVKFRSSSDSKVVKVVRAR